MGEHDVQDRVKLTTPAARTRAESEAGPFSGGATRVADAASLKSLIEMTAAHDDLESDGRKTREIDPAHFRALLRQQEEAAPVAAATAEPALEPPQHARFEDELDAAFADPDAGADAASPAPPAVVAAAATEPEPERVTTAAVTTSDERVAFADELAPEPVEEAAVEALTVEAPAVAAREPAPKAVLPMLPDRGPSARTLVIASIVLLVIAAFVLMLALS